MVYVECVPIKMSLHLNVMVLQEIFITRTRLNPNNFCLKLAAPTDLVLPKVIGLSPIEKKYV